MYSGPEPPSLAQKGTEGHKIMTFLTWKQDPFLAQVKVVQIMLELTL